ncbi:hypothetical protein GCM10019815_18720 [Pediococcus damnosus]|nr:hypothetical protein PDA01_04940 [Pediococcus damnosus]
MILLSSIGTGDLYGYVGLIITVILVFWIVYLIKKHTKNR